MKKLVVGCGYLGKRVARLWLDEGADVFVVTRSDSRAERLETEGFSPIVADVTKPMTLARLPVVSSVLFSVGYDRSCNRTIHEVYFEGLRDLLDALSSNTKRVIYTSSIGVYGPGDGNTINETSPCRPNRAGGDACLQAEQLLAAHPLGMRGIVLRLAGLYGPGRLPRSAGLLAGDPTVAPPDGFVNLIHVDDAAQVVLAAERLAIPPRTYVVSDGNPVERRVYLAELARLLDAPAPTFIAPDSDSPGPRGGNKRVLNQRMVEELQVKLSYPTYREGLAGSL